MKQNRCIVLSDIHQSLDEFTELLNKVQYNKSQDRLILLGDYLDRNSNHSALETIRKIRELNLPFSDVLKGNHENRYIRWYKHGHQFYEGKPYYKDFSDEDANFICQMPSYVKIRDNWLGFHAGIRPHIPIDKQKENDLIYLRYIDSTGKSIGIKKVLNGEAQDIHHWTEYGPFMGMNCVVGHTVHSKETPLITRYTDGSAVYSIDTGCCFGGNLSALIIKDDNTTEIVQVKAKQVYYRGYGEGGN